VKDLNYQLKNLCTKAGHGSYSTRFSRHSILQQTADQLHNMGYKIKTAEGLKPKHVEALINLWKEEGLNTGTLKNRITQLRWWAREVGKAGIIAKNNIEYGIHKRGAYKENRAFSLSNKDLSKVAESRIRMALRLQEAFGLRKEEALKLRPSIAYKGDHLHLKASWTKGGRARSIPITNEYQRSLLDYMQQVVSRGSLIPNDKSYIQFVRTYYEVTKAAGITKPHGLRHQYAQNRYRELTGGMEPRVCGGKPKANMSEMELMKDFAARMEISQELGHNRLEITNVYLGGAN